MKHGKIKGVSVIEFCFDLVFFPHPCRPCLKSTLTEAMLYHYFLGIVRHCTLIKIHCIDLVKIH
jgi:hypothetical protein